MKLEKNKMTTKIEKILGLGFSRLSKASARKKVYSLKAAKEGRENLSHLLRTISESESIQARRLFNSFRGQIDNSEQYISSIFEKEVDEIIKEYSANLSLAKQENNKALIQMLFQLQAAERRILSLYSKETKDIKDVESQRHFVCQFCGYISMKKPPQICPICGADKSGFNESP